MEFQYFLKSENLVDSFLRPRYNTVRTLAPAASCWGAILYPQLPRTQALWQGVADDRIICACGVVK